MIVRHEGKGVPNLGRYAASTADCSSSRRRHSHTPPLHGSNAPSQASDRPTDRRNNRSPAPSLHLVHSYALENLGRALSPSLPLECRRYGWFLRRFPSRKRFRTNHRKWLRRADGRSNQASRENSSPAAPLQRPSYPTETPSAPSER